MRPWSAITNKQDIRVLFGRNALDRPLNPLDVERNHRAMGAVFMEEDYRVWSNRNKGTRRLLFGRRNSLVS
jgi:hypothetical protein